jgi:signal transduction histidine kinase
VSALLAKTLRSTTFKQALVFIGVFGAAIIALLIYVYVSTASYVRGRADDEVKSELAILRRAYVSGGRNGVVNAIERRIGDEHFVDSVYLFADASFAPVAGNLQIWPSILQGPSGWGNFNAVKGKENAALQQPLRAAFGTFPDSTHILVGKSVEALDELEDKIKTALALSIALIFVLAGAVSISVTRRTVGRIEAINEISRVIIQSGLGGRIPLRGSRDEWDELAANLNSMLGRIEALMSEVKQFTDNVAHDLRTPLTRMRGRLEKAQDQQQNSGADGTLIADALADLDNVLGMFASLMRISQIEARDRTRAFHKIDLAGIAREVVELFDAAAEAKGIRLEASGNQSVMIDGDRDLLFDAMANLVDNAIKHGGVAGRATLEVTESKGGALLSVADDGPGIPVDERQHVFKRFYRLERSRGTAGNGLGLSLVAAVARLHGANIEILNRDPGLEIRLSFPCSVRSGVEFTPSTIDVGSAAAHRRP